MRGSAQSFWTDLESPHSHRGSEASQVLQWCSRPGVDAYWYGAFRLAQQRFKVIFLPFYIRIAPSENPHIVLAFL